MTTPTYTTDHAAQPKPAGRPAPSKKQSAANRFAAEHAMKLKWKSLIGAAHAVWNRISPEELAKVQGSIPTLAGLVQLRHQLSREESDAQVKAFFATHLPVEAAPPPGR